MTTYTLCAQDDPIISAAGFVSTRQFSADHIDDVLDNVGYFLQGVGFVLDGQHIALVDKSVKTTNISMQAMAIKFAEELHSYVQQYMRHNHPDKVNPPISCVDVFRMIEQTKNHFLTL